MTFTCNLTVAWKAFACNAVSAFKQTAQHIEFNRCKIQIEHMIRNFEIFHEYLLFSLPQQYSSFCFFEQSFLRTDTLCPSKLSSHILFPRISLLYGIQFSSCCIVFGHFLQCSVYITVLRSSIDVV